MKFYHCVSHNYQPYAYMYEDLLKYVRIAVEIHTKSNLILSKLMYSIDQRKGGKFMMQFILLYDWRESCLLIGLISLHKSLCLPGNWSKPVQKLILHEYQLELVSRS